jgi:uncharacterized protein YkwD
MEDWIQLTEEDIARAYRLTRVDPPMPEAITITESDIPAEPSARPESNSAVLKVTLDDLRPAKAPAQPITDNVQLEQLMFELVNRERGRHLPGWVGTANLLPHPGLTTVARQHSADMLKRQYVDHVTPEGVTAAQRIQRYGITYVACGENIGIVYGEAARSVHGIEDIHRAFMNQPRSLTNHRGNLLNPIWTHIGIGIADSPDGALVATQVFISAPASRLRGR